MIAGTWGPVSEWACKHPMGLVWIGMALIIALVIIQEIQEKGAVVGSFDEFSDPRPDPTRPEWVHPGMVITEPNGDNWEVSFTGPEFVTVTKVRNISYDEIRDWAVFA